MTVIFGVNLCDRLYISGDSRLSKLVIDADGHEEVVFVHDNMLKVENIKGSQGVVIASAGDAKLAKAFINGIAKQPFVREGIVAIRASVEEYAASVADRYISEHGGYTDIKATFIIGGADRSRNKKIIGKDLMPLIESYSGKKKGHKGNLKQVIVDGLINAKGLDASNPERELPVKDTVLFSLTIDRRGISFSDTKWGEYLIYGPPGLKKDDVPASFAGTLEFGPRAGEMESDNLYVTAMIHDLAENGGYASVGGALVTKMVNHDQATYMMDGDVFLTPANNPAQIKAINRIRVGAHSSSGIYRVEVDGSHRKLMPVSKYKPTNSAKCYL